MHGVLKTSCPVGVARGYENMHQFLFAFTKERIFWSTFAYDTDCRIQEVGVSGTWSHVDQIREPLASRIRHSYTWKHVNQIQYPEIKKRCGDTATVYIIVLTKGYK